MNTYIIQFENKTGSFREEWKEPNGSLALEKFRDSRRLGKGVINLFRDSILLMRIHAR